MQFFNAELSHDMRNVCLSEFVREKVYLWNALGPERDLEDNVEPIKIKMWAAKSKNRLRGCVSSIGLIQDSKELSQATSERTWKALGLEH